MINFILYEDNEQSIKNYISLINNFMINLNDNYQIKKITKFDQKVFDMIKELDTKKIFLIDIEVPGKSGLEFAREIRMNGDWLSPIIICTSHDEFKMTGFTSKILTLDFIRKSKDMNKDVMDALNVAYNIISSHKAYKFKYSGEYHQIPLHNILYIEKNLNDNYSTIYTKRNKYVVKDTINNIYSSLNDERFFQSHRSCIINLDNIISVDFTNNLINFGTHSTDLLSREAKKELKSILNS